MYFKHQNRKPLTKRGDLILLMLIFTCYPMKTFPNSKYVTCFSTFIWPYTKHHWFCAPFPFPHCCQETILIDLVAFFFFYRFVGVLLLWFFFGGGCLFFNLRIVSILRRCCRLHIACSSDSAHYVFPLQLVCLILSQISVTDFKKSVSPSCYPTRELPTCSKISLPNISKPLRLNAQQLNWIYLITSLVLSTKHLP